MRVTFILASPNWGGGFKVNVIYAQQLKRMGHIVRIILPPPTEMTFKQRLKSWLRGNGWPDELLRRKSHLDDSGVDHHVLDRFRPVTDSDVPDGDVVIASFWPMAEWVAALNAKKGAKVFFIQGHDIYGHQQKERVLDTYRLPFHKIVVSQWLKRVISEESDDPIIDVVPNCVNRKQFFAAVRGKQLIPSVGFLYSTNYVKGMDSTLAALRIVRERIPNLRIISFGTQHPNRHLPLPTGTMFCCLPAQKELRNLYARCDVWVTGSRSDGFNLTVLEAMACRTPVVSTRTGWPEQAVRTGWNGVLVDIDDVSGLARGMEWVLTRTDEQWRELSANAYATTSGGSWEESARMFEEALKRACIRAARGEFSAV